MPKIKPPKKADYVRKDGTYVSGPNSLDYRGGEAAYLVVYTVHDALSVVGETIVKKIQKNLDRNYPPASRSGEFPAKRSGDLQKGIDYEVDGMKLRITSSVPTKFPYDVWLEVHANRSFMKKTIENNKTKIKQIFSQIKKNMPKKKFVFQNKV